MPSSREDSARKRPGGDLLQRFSKTDDLLIRFNPNHDDHGRFASGSGGGSFNSKIPGVDYGKLPGINNAEQPFITTAAQRDALAQELHPFPDQTIQHVQRDTSHEITGMVQRGVPETDPFRLTAEAQMDAANHEIAQRGIEPIAPGPQDFDPRYIDGAIPTEMPTVRMTAVGDVQGVGFRNATMAQAQTLGVQGYVRNTPGGTMEATVVGAPEALKGLETWMRRGPQYAHVQYVDVTPRPIAEPLPYKR